MSIKLFIAPNPDRAGAENGIGRVVKAQYDYLPQYGFEFVENPQEADIVACHIHHWGVPQVDVLHCHGLEWTADAPGYQGWHHGVNRAIIETARKAWAITVPSDWVAEPFRRDMRIEPTIIGHGIDLAEWEPLPVDQRGDYLLWNKNRADLVCDPGPAIELARRGLPVISTFGDPSVMQVTGKLPYPEMRELIRRAGVYLATTKETFGIGILEALACGVPVLGYAHGGINDLIEHKANGYLVEPGDIAGLVEGYYYLAGDLQSKQLDISANEYDWPQIIHAYARLYRQVYEEKQKPRGYSVVITNHNYGNYVNQAIESCLAQILPPEKVIVVDDASTDDSLARLNEWESQEEVEILANETNQGVAASRNRGVAAVTSEYVICLDADDWLEPEYASTLFSAMEEDRGLGVAYTGLNIHFPDGTAGQSPWPPEFGFDGMTKPTNPPSNCVPCAAMFRRSMWERAGGYQQIHAPGEDTEFFLRGLSVGFDGKRATQAPLFNYRVHGGSASRSKIYKPIDTYHPWMRDGLFPMAAPVSKQPLVRSYSQPVISVIIPVGPGHAKYLPDALNSLVGQTFREWEAIVVDDVDTHAERVEMVSLLIKTYPFVKVVGGSGKIERSAGAARNRGLKQAKAPLSLFLDADDWLAPEALEKMVKAYVRDRGKNYVYSDWVAFENGEMKPQQCLDYSQEIWFDKMQHAVTCLVETEIAREVGFDESLPSWEDWAFFADFAAKGYCGVRVAEPLLYYRVHSGTRRIKALENSVALRERILARYKGVEIMACGSCGGNAVQKVETAVEWDAALLQAVKPQIENGRVLMEFVGANQAPITWTIGGTIYVGANDGTANRYAQALPDHVDRLLQTGKWAIAS